MDDIYLLRQTAYEFLINICSRIDSIVDIFNSGYNTLANERVAFLTEDLITLTEGIMALHKDVGFKLDIEELNGKLRLILGQFKNEDYLFVSDLLKYELKPLLEQWQGELRHDL